MEILLVIVISAVLGGIFVLASEPDVDEKAGKKALDEFYRQYGQMDHKPSKIAEHGRFLAVVCLTVLIFLIVGIFHLI